MIDKQYVETKLTHQLRTAEATGHPVKTSEKAIASNLRDYRIYGNHDQDWCGENMWRNTMTFTETTLNGITCVKNNDGSYTFSGTTVDSNPTFLTPQNRNTFYRFNTGTYYVPFALDQEVNIGFNFTKLSNNALKQIQLTKGQRSFVLNEECYLSQMYLWFHDTLGTEYNITFYPQLTKADITDFIPYVPLSPDLPTTIKSVGEKSKNFLGALKNTNKSVYPTNLATREVDVENQIVTVTNGGSRYGCARLLYSFEAGKTYTFTATVDEANEENYATLYAPPTLFNNNNSKWSSHGSTGSTLRLTFTVDKDVAAGANTGFVGLYPDTKDTDTAKTAKAVFSNISLIEGTPEKPYSIPLEISQNWCPTPVAAISETTTNGVTYSIDTDGTIHVNGNITQSFAVYNTPANPITLPAGQWLTRAFVTGTVENSKYPNGSNLIVKLQTDTGDGIVLTNNDTYHYAFSTTDLKITKVYFWFYNMKTGTENNVNFNNVSIKFVMVRGFNSPFQTVYKPFMQPQKHYFYLSEPLHGIGNYKDYIDFNNQKVVRKIATKTLDGTENWAKIANGAFVLNIPNIAFGSWNTRANVVRCNMFTEDSCSNVENTSTSNIIAVHGNIRRIEVRTVTSYTLAEFKAYLAELAANGTPMYIEYGTVAQTEEPIENLPELNSYKGLTTYWVNTKVNSDFYCKYKYRN